MRSTVTRASSNPSGTATATASANPVTNSSSDCASASTSSPLATMPQSRDMVAVKVDRKAALVRLPAYCHKTAPAISVVGGGSKSDKSEVLFTCVFAERGLETGAWVTHLSGPVGRSPGQADRCGLAVEPGRRRAPPIAVHSAPSASHTNKEQPTPDRSDLSRKKTPGRHR